MSYLNELKKDELKILFNKLKNIQKDPENIQWSYFNDLKNEIDIAFTQLELNKENNTDDDYDVSINQEINKNLLMLIEKIGKNEFNLI